MQRINAIEALAAAVKLPDSVGLHAIVHETAPLSGTAWSKEEADQSL